MITLRLDPTLEQAVQNTAKNLGLTKSELIRASIQEYLYKLNSPTAAELGKDLFGKYESGTGNLSRDRKKIITDKLKTKRP